MLKVIRIFTRLMCLGGRILLLCLCANACTSTTSTLTITPTFTPIRPTATIAPSETPTPTVETMPSTETAGAEEAVTAPGGEETSSATPITPTITVAPTVIASAPQEVIFQASDGQELNGLYYPATVNPSPVIVLMHWAGGDQNDWVEIAYWLQNRGLGGKTEPSQPWFEPSWFPPLESGESYAVFTFTFRGCEGGCRDFDRANWQLDAQAAMQAAISLEGVDPLRILAAGASIGADGAPDGCLWLNQTTDGRCIGAFSFSPGNYLGMDYPTAITTLGAFNPPVPANCLFATGDGTSADACNSASGLHYTSSEWAGANHGMLLIVPDLEPLPLDLFLEFIRAQLKQPQP